MGSSGKFVTLGLLLACGCAHFHPQATEVPPEVQAAQAMPQAAKNRVHVAFVSGVVDLTGLGPLRAAAVELGFIKAYSGQVGCRAALMEAFRASLQKEPDARFALVAGGGGAVLANELAMELQAMGAPVDLIVYLDTSGPSPEGARVLSLSSKDPTTRPVLVQELVEVASHVRVMDAPALPVGARGEWDALGPPEVPTPELPNPRPIIEAGQTPPG